MASMQSDISALALFQFRKDWPFMASMLDDMRVKAATGGPACGGAVQPFRASKTLSVHPDGNHGDNNQVNRTAFK